MLKILIKNKTIKQENSNTEKLKVKNNSTAIFTIKDFSFSYPLSQLNKKTIRINGQIDIKKGERVLIKGPSGSGKSTLLLALSGIIPYEITGKLGGKILFKGQNIDSIPSENLHRNIGIVFQNPYSQKVTSSVEDELVFYLENLGYSPGEINRRLNKLYKSFNFSAYMHRSTNNLSGGELQKIILSSVLIAEPEVILFDEPTSYLDIKSEISFYKYLKDNLKDQTIIIVDHKLNHNISFIKRIIELDSKGNIIFDGHIKEYKKLFISGKLSREKKSWNIEKFVTLSKSTHEKTLKLELSNLYFSYGGNRGDKPILNNINLTIETGRVVSIFGLNGSGKTTLIKVTSRLIKLKKRKSSGKIRMFEDSGRTIKKREFFDNLGVVFQNPETHFLYLTVGKEITNGRYIEDVDKIAKAFNITDSPRQNPFTLSEGQKRRLNLANTFFLSKRIVLMDEPTFGQDENGILNLIKTINILKRTGMGFLIVSHDTKFIKSISDKVYYLKNGKLKELKTIKKAFGENSENN